MTRLAFVDTETTGLDPDRHEIWEVGLIIREIRDIADDLVAYQDTEHTWQLPVDLGRADAMGLKIGRFHERRIREVTEVGEFVDEFCYLTRGAHLVGAVISFDEERLRRLARANGACPEWHYHLVDVEALAAGYLGAEPPWDSTALSFDVGVNPDLFDRHTALGDARWAAAIYHAVMILAQNR